MALAEANDYALSSSDDDEAILMLLLCEKKRKKRRFWVHPLNLMQPKKGLFVTTRNLIDDPVRFQSFHRMKPETFAKLLNIMGPRLAKQDTNYRLAVSPEERLVITLRFLADGTNFKAMSFSFLRGDTTIREVVHDTCAALWEELCPQFMPPPSTQKWREIAKKFNETWQMPNCIGILDGKHVRIRKPGKTGSAFHNYLDYFSLILLAVADAGGLFSAICVGDYGRNSDGGVRRNSPFGKLLLQKQLRIPSPSPLPAENVDFPYYFVADEAFPLTENIMRPYPARGLTNERRVFNARLSRARKTIECAFGRMTSKFRVFYSPIACKPQNTENIVKAACIFHNFIYKVEKLLPRLSDERYRPFGAPLQQNKTRGTVMSLNNRNMLAKFFLKPQNALPWQNIYCV